MKPMLKRRARIGYEPLTLLMLVLFFLSSQTLVLGRETGPTGSSAAAPGPTEGTTSRPARLYESISGFLDGIRGKDAQREKSQVQRNKEQRREPKAVQAADPEPERIVEQQTDLARSRMQRGEWNLALPSLERAAKKASTLTSANETERLDKMIDTAKRKAAGASKSSAVPGEVTNSVGMKMVAVPSGTFTMGSTDAEVRRLQNEWTIPEDLLRTEQPAHKVDISGTYLLGKYPVTVGQFRLFVEETGYRTVAEAQGFGWVYDQGKKHWVKKSNVSWRNPGTQTGDDYPVTLLCYADAEAFCNWLSRKEGRKYALPTEAQWEYAARSGQDGQRFPWGNDYPDGRKLNIADRRSPMPWADRTVDDGYAGPSPVGSYEPNGFWLYDMVGNVWQLCADYYEPRAYQGKDSAVTTDPGGPARGKKRVVRGGNWAFGAGIARNAFRTGIDSDLCVDMAGFRVAAAAGPGDKPVVKRAPGTAGRSSINEEEIRKLLEDVKSLTARGQRLEARRKVEQWVGANSRQAEGVDDPVGFVRKVLDSTIDLTKDKSMESFKNSLGMKMVRIPSGAFVMGSSEADIAWAMTSLAQGQPISLENEFPFHKIRITRPFYLSSTEVTVEQFKAFVDETGYVTDAEDQGGGQVYDTKANRFEQKAGTSWKNPGWTIAPDQPVTVVSYDDAQAFVEWLTAKEKLPYKLPTEAQWEYAARGGRPMATFPWGETPVDGRKANFADKNTDFEWRDRNIDDGYKYVAPVGSYEANGYGLYDMAGNALEWVRDHYAEDYYRYTPEIDPEGPGHGENRVTKGGDWSFGPVSLRCAFRGWSRSELAFNNTGFRVAVDFATPFRPFHFSDSFLTREWVPGQDQREVAVAVAKEQERRNKAKPVETASTPAQPQVVNPPVHKGVLILAFTPKSDGKKAGLAKGDVIIEYNGVRDLTTEKYLALCALTRQEKINPVIVFVRSGYEYAIRAARGFLGTTVMDTTVRGPFKKKETTPAPSHRDEKEKNSKRLDWT
jgi:formylglycine-generating enzyme required for sulfatase activity